MSDYIVNFPNYVLPGELITKILLMLPSKSLFRFKSVCKSWRALISDPQFLAKHLLPDDDPNLLLLVKRRDKTNKEHVFSLLSYQTLKERSKTRSLPYPNLSNSVNNLRFDIQILGSCCNGVLCLKDSSQAETNFILWSPASGNVKILPYLDLPLPPEAFSAECMNFGFGYDARNDDYKAIIVATQFEDHDGCSLDFNLIEIYSLKAGSWKVIEKDDVPACFYNDADYRFMAYVNGVFSWFTCDPVDGDQDMILWFDLSREVFGTTMLPADTQSVNKIRFDRLSDDYEDLDDEEEIDEHKNPFYWTRNFLVLNDQCIALIVREKEEKCFHVWVLLEFGVEESWINLFTIGPLVGIERPVWFWKNGKMIMENSDGHLFLCDPFTQEMKPLDIVGLPKSVQIVAIEEKYIF